MILDEFRLVGEVALLAGRGPGWLTPLAVALVEAGARVAVAAPGDEASLVVEEVRRRGGEGLALPADLTRPRAAEEALGRAVSELGPVDILVNAQKQEFGRPLAELAPEEWQGVLDQNLTAVFLTTRAAGKHMLARRRGKIVNVVSGLGERGLPNGSAYCASLGGVVQLTRTLAQEWGRMNVRVNAIGAGWMQEESVPAAGDPLVSYIPMRRRGSPDDLTPMMVFLASEASSYMSGYLYFVDGGLNARG
ncbi:MAG: SDR family oxidoreductase [Deltaproteobacteria bacterium]|nr:SDR family oxidoreductase [Deltaproteobacteria bacterium]